MRSSFGFATVRRIIANGWMILFLGFVFWGCNEEVIPVYEKLNTPLGLEIINQDGGHLLTFYGYNRGKHEFVGYAIYQASSASQSRQLVQLKDALFYVSVYERSNLYDRDVDMPIQIKFSGNDPGDNENFYSELSLESGAYVSVRAFPRDVNYTAESLDVNLYQVNTDERQGTVVSYPSNTVQVP